jgi:hypothetical protein
MNAKINDTMTCRQARQTLLERFDGGEFQELPELLDNHLTTCASCRTEGDKLLALSKGLQRLPVSDPGMNFRANLLPSVRLNLEKSRAGKPKRDLTWAPSLGLAVMLAVALVRQPTPISPPSWFQQQATTLETGSLADQDYASLSQALEQRDSLALDLSGNEMNLILNLSESTTSITADPMDRLSALSDEAVEAILKELESAGIRS